jgi:spermidine/putrescine transport system substrate-binding protein
MSAEDLFRARMTRRRFLRVAGAAAASSSLLAACGGDEEGAPEPAAPAPTEVEDELNVLNWGDYIDFAIKPFEEKYGTKVNIAYYGSETEAFAKVRANPGRFDTFNIGVGFLVPAVKQGLIQPLDIDRIPSYKLSYSAFQPGPFEVDGEIYGVAYAWGTNALAYNKKLAPKPVDSWDAFWDPAFKGKTSLLDDAKDQFLPACLYLGIDFNSPQESDQPKIREAIIARAKNMRTLWSTGDDLQRFMLQGDVVLADCYDGLGFSITEKDPNIVYHIPQEGTYGWFDGPTLLTGARHPNAAYAWIDFVTSTKVQTMVAEQVNYAPGNAEIPGLITPDLRGKLGLDEAESTISQLKFFEFLGADWERWIEETWAEAKAA